MVTFNYEYVNTKFKEKAKVYSERQCLINKELGVTCYKKAFVVPFDKIRRGEVITEDLTGVSTDFKRKVDISEYNLSNAKKSGKAVLLGNFWIYVWGHCFTDHFNKLWFAFTEECKKLQSQGAELIALSCKPQAPKYFQSLFELTGFDWNSLKFVTETTQYDELYVPDNCYLQIEGEWNRFYTKEYVGLLDRMKMNVRRLALADGHYPQYDRIYLTRTQGSFGTFRDLGEKLIEDVFRKEGYTIVAPEKLTVPQQIWLMMNVKDLVATDGSICHASTFCQARTKITVLMKADFLSENQIVSDQIADLDVTYIGVHHSFFAGKDDPWHGPFLFCITNNLERYFDHKIPHKPLYLRKDFYLYCLRKLYVETLKKSSCIDVIVKKIIGIKRTY